MELLEVELEPDFRDAAFDFKDESCQSVGFALHRLEVIFIDAKDLAEIDDAGLGLEEIRAVIEFLVVFFYIGFIEFIVDFAHDFFDDVFHGDESRSAAVFVDNDGDVDLLLAEVLKQVVRVSS